jgi:radical SAM superfamily enzyme YgiQ (UPF0313 family)
MKILLINPIYSVYGGGIEGHGGKAPPLNLGYLAAYVREKRDDYKVSILDSEALCMDFDKIEEYVKKEGPDIVGITSSTPAYSNALKIARICKKVSGKSKIILGGAHPSAFPGKTAQEDAIDFVVWGEGEITFYELLEAIENKKTFFHIDGLAFKDNGRVIINKSRELMKNLDILPFPARDLMPHHLYQPPPTKRVSTFKATSLTSARGCPYNCSFCSAKVIWSRKYRYRSPKNVVDEIEYCVNRFNLREFNLTDELFTLESNRAAAFCNEVINRKLDIAWVCMSRAGQVTEGLLRLMKAAGCKEISFGLESGDEEILRKMNKDNSLEAARESIRLVKKVGIKTHATYMIGNLGETGQTIRKTIDFAKKLNTDVAAFFINTPLPGTQLYEEALRLGYIRPDVDWNDFSPLPKNTPVMTLPGLASEELMSWHRQAIKEYYLRPGFILEKLRRIRSKVDILNLYNGLKLFLRIQQKKLNKVGKAGNLKAC